MRNMGIRPQVEIVSHWSVRGVRVTRLLTSFVDITMTHKRIIVVSWSALKMTLIGSVISKAKERNFLLRFSYFSFCFFSNFLDIFIGSQGRFIKRFVDSCLFSFFFKFLFYCLPTIFYTFRTTCIIWVLYRILFVCIQTLPLKTSR